LRVSKLKTVNKQPFGRPRMMWRDHVREGIQKSQEIVQTDSRGVVLQRR